MDNYKLDFGKLAYAKIEDITSRINYLETKKQDNYNKLYFSFKVSDSYYNKSVNFSAVKNTDLNFDIKLSGEGENEIAVYLDDIFVFAESITLNGDKATSFEARGVIAGTHKISITVYGNCSDIVMSVNGNNIEYTANYYKLSEAVVGGYDYILKLNDKKITLNRLEGNNLVTVKSDFPKAENICINTYESFIFIFYTVFDKTLFYEIFDTNNEKSIFKGFIETDVDEFTAVNIFGDFILFFTSNNKSYYKNMCYDGQKLILSGKKDLDVSSVKEMSAKVKLNTIYFIYSDSNDNFKFNYTPEILVPQKDYFYYSVSFSAEEIP